MGAQILKDAATTTATSALGRVPHALLLPPKWLRQYEDFVKKNAGSVAQIESALRSLTYIIPGRFSDAEIATESLHTSVQLLSLYHDRLLARGAAPPTPSSDAPSQHQRPPPPPPPTPTPHSRYTSYWTGKSALYRRAALLLQTIQYTELLWEMAAAKRDGRRAGGGGGGSGTARARWRVVVALEAAKAACRLAMMRVTGGRTVVGCPLPEREPPSEQTDGEDADADDEAAREDAELRELMAKEDADEAARRRGGASAERDSTDGDRGVADTGVGPSPSMKLSEERSSAGDQHRDRGSGKGPTSREWVMPRTGLTLPAIPPGDAIAQFLLSKVLTADEIKPAAGLMNRLGGGGGSGGGMALGAEYVYILRPAVYAALCAYAASRAAAAASDASAVAGGGGRQQRRRGGGPGPWYPWLAGLAMEALAFQLRAQALRAQRRGPAGGGGAQAPPSTRMETEEWERRAWQTAWWAMRGPFYERFTGEAVRGLVHRLPEFVGGIVDEYASVWEGYYFGSAT